ncbi:hypothetical protein ATSB10_14270 [Dyella thiooxydans]|uniref:Uncharacterized protein n=1 Tax=Dyella thiooxydans TaxID=445710 RepID=A0A160MZK8_9GAMM|nr:hypothetical protein [Dyella thiooxydans]AND68881.1 hypothetical protein ATSB10_14270 [Dyella thiooxydans]
MHLELPKVKLESLKDFAKHYFMIVLSILTALGLEAWIEHAHHAEAARVAVERMQHELHEDLGNIDRSMARNDATLTNLLKLDRLLRADMVAGKSDAQINADIHLHRELFALNLDFPTLATDAWDVAVANQSAGWVDAPMLQRYSSAYSSTRELASWVQHDAVLLFNGPRMVDFFTDLQTDQPVAPRDFLYEVRQMTTTIHSTQGELRSVRDELRKDLGLPPDSPTQS